MKIIKPSATIWDWEDPIKHIERGGRICYKSEPKGDPEAFVSKLIKLGHLSVLDHASAFYDHNIITDNKYIYQRSGCSGGNVRALVESNEVDTPLSVEHIQAFFQNHSRLTREQELRCCKALHHVTVHFVTNRAIAMQILRHGDGSGRSMESQRYCNYSKGRFGEEITVVEPSFHAKDATWEIASEQAEFFYFRMLKNGLKPEQAREVLPNSTKTEVVFTTRIEHWEHIFKERCPKAADPAMRALMIPLREDFKNRGYIE